MCKLTHADSEQVRTFLDVLAGPTYTDGMVDNVWAFNAKGLARSQHTTILGFLWCMARVQIDSTMTSQPKP